MFWDKHDTVADPVVVAWDAIQRGTNRVPDGFDESEVAMIASFLTLGNVQTPSARFVEQLGQRLAELGPRPHAVSPAATTSPATNRISAPAPPKLFPEKRMFRLSGWMLAAAALLAAILIGGALLTWWTPPPENEGPAAIPAVIDQQATADAVPQGTTFSAVFDPTELGLPELTSWDNMTVYLLELEPGEQYDLSQPWFASIDGIAVLQAQDGSLQVDPAGPATRYRAGSDSNPEAFVGESIALQTGETVAYSVQDGASLTNTSGQPAVALLGVAGKDDPTVIIPGGLPPGNAVKNWRPIYGSLPTVPAASARISFERIELAPGEQSSQKLVPHQEILGIATDTATQTKSKDLGLAGTMEDAPPPGPGDFVPSQLVDTSLMTVDSIWLSNPGDEPIYIYLVGVEYLESAQVGPVATPAKDGPAATLLDGAIDLAALGIDNEANWDISGVLYRSGLEAGSEIHFDDEHWGHGLMVFTVTEGQISVTADGPSDLFLAGSTAPELVAPGRESILGMGDSVALDAAQGARVRNITQADVTFLASYVFETPAGWNTNDDWPFNFQSDIWDDAPFTQTVHGLVTARIERVVLHGEPYSVDVGSDDMVVVLGSNRGALLTMDHAEAPGVFSSIGLSKFGPGSYELTPQNDKEMVLYVVRFSGASVGNGTPASAVGSPESAQRREPQTSTAPPARPEGEIPNRFELPAIFR